MILPQRDLQQLLIDSDTKARAAWLMESLHSEDPPALHNFADNWTHPDYNEAARWMDTLPSEAE